MRTGTLSVANLPKRRTSPSGEGRSIAVREGVMSASSNGAGTTPSETCAKKWGASIQVRHGPRWKDTASHGTSAGDGESGSAVGRASKVSGNIWSQ